MVANTFNTLSYFWTKPESVVTIRDIFYTFDFPIADFESADGMIVIKDRNMKISTGFASDCVTGWSSGSAISDYDDAPLRSLIPDKKIGKYWFAALIHDVLYRYLKEFQKAGLKIDRKMCDYIFYTLMKQVANPVVAFFYYRTVRLVGWYYAR
jgi:hypothetical protein